MNLSTREQALKDRASHQFQLGVGYVKLAPPPLPTTHKGRPGDCDPPKATKDGTFHLLSVPGGSMSLEFEWIETEKAWARFGGNRMAFTAAYLAAHGWKYSRPK